MAITSQQSAIIINTGNSQGVFLANMLHAHGRDMAFRICRRQLYATAEFIRDLWDDKFAAECLYAVADATVSRIPPDWVRPAERDAADAEAAAKAEIEREFSVAMASDQFDPPPPLWFKAMMIAGFAAAVGILVGVGVVIGLVL